MEGGTDSDLYVGGEGFGEALCSAPGDVDRLPPVSWPVKLGVYVHGERGGATAPARCIPEAIGQAASLGVVELESAVVREQKHDHDWRLPRVKSSAVAPGAFPHTPSHPSR